VSFPFRLRRSKTEIDVVAWLTPSSWPKRNSMRTEDSVP
jgi:hypothetical protein